MDPSAVAGAKAEHAAAGLDVGDLDPDPIRMVQGWWDEVQRLDLPEPAAVVLITASPDANPLGRHVLLRALDERGFTWFTNRASRKGRQLAANPQACLVFPWYPVGRQVIVRGPAADIDDAESDAYWATRPPGSRIAAAISEQSAPIADRRWIEARFAELEARYPDGDVPRPAHWGGQRLRPTEIELWQGRPNRMHDRFLYERDVPEATWRISRLAP